MQFAEVTYDSWFHLDSRSQRTRRGLIAVPDITRCFLRNRGPDSHSGKAASVALLAIVRSKRLLGSEILSRG